MLEKIKKNKKVAIAYNLACIFVCWMIFFIIWFVFGEAMSVFFESIFSEGFLTSLIYLVGAPVVFSVTLFFLLVGGSKKDKKKWVFRGIVIPLLIWFIFPLFVVLTYFFGFGGAY